MRLLTITIMLGNDSMQTAGEVVDSVRRAIVGGSDDVFEPLRLGEGGTIYDDNGNRVGVWTVESQ